MFCTSLRRRPAFAGVVQGLVEARGLNARENDLRTHDISIPIPPATAAPARQLRVLLLSPTDVTPVALRTTLTRIQRFTALTGGVDMVLAFLLTSPSTSPQIMSTETAGTEAYITLQASLFPQPHPPFLPLVSVDALPTLLLRHVSALALPVRETPHTTTPFELLQLCSATVAEQGQGMDPHTAFRITDLFPNLPALARAFSNVRDVAALRESSSPITVSQDGSEQSVDVARLRALRGIVGEVEFENLADFWAEEWVVD